MFTREKGEGGDKERQREEGEGVKEREFHVHAAVLF